MKTENECHAISNCPETQFATRRKFLGAAGLGLGFASLIRTQDVFSMAQHEDEAIRQTVGEHARRKSLPEDAFGLPRWVSDHTGPYDLSDPCDNHFAYVKGQANLSGDYHWLVQYGWILICPPGEPAYPFLGRLTLARMFVTPTDPSWALDVREHDPGKNPVVHPHAREEAFPGAVKSSVTVMATLIVCASHSVVAVTVSPGAV